MAFLAWNIPAGKVQPRCLATALKWVLRAFRGEVEGQRSRFPTASVDSTPCLPAIQLCPSLHTLPEKHSPCISPTLLGRKPGDYLQCQVCPMASLWATQPSYQGSPLGFCCVPEMPFEHTAPPGLSHWLIFICISFSVQFTTLSLFQSDYTRAK